MSDFQIQKKQAGAVVVLTISGKLDAKTAPGLSGELKGLVGTGHSKIVCDMSGVSYIASAGVGTLKAGLVDAKKNGGDLRLAGTAKRSQRRFRRAGFHKAVYDRLRRQRGGAGVLILTPADADSRDRRSLRISCDVSELSRVRDELKEFLGASFDRIDTNRIILSVDEALANIVEHAYEGPEFADAPADELIIDLSMERAGRLRSFRSRRPRSRISIPRRCRSRIWKSTRRIPMTAVWAFFYT